MKEFNFPYEAVDKWIKTFPKLKVLGPLTTTSAEYARVLDFRMEWHKRDAPYLTESFQSEIETSLQLDERSLHFALEYDGQIIACVRTTPPPFELSALSEQFRLRSEAYTNYHEFSRLCTNRNMGRKALYASMLVVKAAQYLFSNELADGIVGICRDNRVSYMKHIGLHSDPSPIWLEARQGSYQLLHASKDELLNFYAIRLNEILADKKTEVSLESQPA